MKIVNGTDDAYPASKYSKENGDGIDMCIFNYRNFFLSGFVVLSLLQPFGAQAWNVDIHSLVVDNDADPSDVRPGATDAVPGVFYQDAFANGDFLTNPDYPGIVPAYGKVRGNWIENAGSATALEVFGVQAIPVPAAAWLLGSALLGLLGTYRRQV